MALTANIKISELLTHPGESGVPRNPYSITGWEYVPVSWDVDSKNWTTDSDDRVHTYDSYKMALRDIGYYVGICIGVYSSAPNTYDGLWDRLFDVETYTAAYGPRIANLEKSSTNYDTYFGNLQTILGSDYDVTTGRMDKDDVSKRFGSIEGRVSDHDRYFDNIQRILDGNIGYYDYKKNNNTGANVYTMLKYFEKSITYLNEQLFNDGGLKSTLDTAIDNIGWNSSQDKIAYTFIGGGSGSFTVGHASYSPESGNANTVDGYHIAVVDKNDGRYNAKTIYFVTP